MQKHPSAFLMALLFGGLLFLQTGVQTAAGQYSDGSDRPRSTEQSRPAPVPQSGPNRGVDETVVVPRDRPTRPAPRAQEKASEPVNRDDTVRFSTEVDLVNLSVVVQDKNGNFIPELKKEHFRILEDGKPQPIQTIATSEAPMTVAMVIEFSSRYWEFLYQTLYASYGFVQSLRPEDWVAVVMYDLKTQILQDFTRNKSAAFDALNSMRIPGFSETNLFDALTETIDRMSDIEGKKAIVLISSGVDTFSKTRYDQALKIVQASDTPVYAIGTGQAVRMWYESRGYMSSLGNLEFLQADNQLRSFARLSGGRSYLPRFEGQFPEIYGDISAALRNEYQIAYSPSNPVKDGKFRKIKVEIVGPDGKALKIVDPKGKEIKYEVRHREGYYASREVE
jgi:Ca-activated chloride channel homolog